MKKIIVLIFALLLVSCNSKTEEKMDEIRLKNAQLDYLRKLHLVKENIQLSEQLRVLDSMIKEQNEEVILNE